MSDESIISVRIEALAVGGAMIGTVIAGSEGQVGKKAFVPFTVPGETVTARVLKESASFIEAELVAIQVPVALRINPPCQYFTDCGGCQLQHIPVPNQREYKQALVETTLRVRGVLPRSGVSLLAAELPAEQYRSRITVHLAPPDLIGFYRKGSGAVVPISTCHIASECLNVGLQRLQELSSTLCSRVPSAILEESGSEPFVICKLPHTASGSDIKLVKQAVESLFVWCEIRKGRSVVHRTSLMNSKQSIAYGHFSQVNRAANSVLVDNVLDWIPAGGVDDLYAGSGNFSLPLAARGNTVRAVEMDEELVVYGIDTLRTSATTGTVTFFQSSCERFVRNNTLQETVLLDPPRAGAKEVVRRINPEDTQTIVYVSCSLATFARDAAVLKAKGYELLETKLLDMFPHTHHVELISLFQVQS